jgi:hypothetical protein
MPGLVLIILLILAIAAVMAAFGYLGWRIFRLGRNAFHVGRDIQAGVDRLTPGIAALESKGADLADAQTRLTASLDSLQESLARLEVVSRLLGEAFAPLGAVAHRAFDILTERSVLATSVQRLRSRSRR